MEYSKNNMVILFYILLNIIKNFISNHIFKSNMIRYKIFNNIK